MLMRNTHRSRGSGKGKESEYENGESDCPDDEEVPFHLIKKMVLQRNIIMFRLAARQGC